MSNAASDALPVELAVGLMLTFFSIGIFLLVTGFTWRWQRTLHWGFRWGPNPPITPVISRWSHGATGMLCVILPFSMFAPLGGLWPFHWLLTDLAGICSVGFTTGMMYDCFVRRR